MNDIESLRKENAELRKNYSIKEYLVVSIAEENDRLRKENECIPSLERGFKELQFERHRLKDELVALQAEVERLRDELAAMTDRKADWHRVADERAGEIVRLREELAAAQRDAERYRWLRDGHDDIAVVSDVGIEDSGQSLVVNTFASQLDHDELDAYLDAAMAKEKRDE